eukprot:TRINITY_DN4799_c0_g1_i1.p1 TRINITY_DN4799_c0_g1~~TRINITY_DN4799_c0_g1_i1.p1  ORF type:complete len:251 (-),score=52.34 TRINITY_DN4799_c0_g1_i1:79-795(-)
MADVIQWSCKGCTFIQDAVPGNYRCAVCDTDHSEDPDILAIVPPPAAPQPKPSAPAASEPVVPPCAPEECKEFPSRPYGRDYMCKYYRHNLSKSLPQDLQVPNDVVNFIVHYVEEVFVIGDKIEAIDKMAKWYVATILDIKDEKVFIHWDGWPKKWDEWIPLASDRIAPMLTNTNGKAFGEGSIHDRKPAATTESQYVFNSEHYAQLVAMGFEEEQAIAALRRANGDLPRAVAYLMPQ